MYLPDDVFFLGVDDGIDRRDRLFLYLGLGDFLDKG